MNGNKQMQRSDHQIKYYKNVFCIKCVGNRSELMVVMFRMYGLFQVFLEGQICNKEVYRLP